MAKAAKGQPRTAGGVAYTLYRRRVENINLRVRADGTVAASAHLLVPAAAVDAFVAARADWVRAAQVRAAQARAADRRAAMEAADAALPNRAAALRHLTALCQKWYPAFAAQCPGQRMPRVAVRDMTTRWGSCSLRTGTLAFARRLCAAPLPAQEYVVVHEFCHFAHPDHSPAFWAEVARHMPDYAARRALLRQWQAGTPAAAADI